MKVMIERQIGGKYTVCHASFYQYPIETKKPIILDIQDDGTVITHDRTLQHQQVAVRSGSTISSTMSYEDCLNFIKKHGMELIDLPAHTATFVHLNRGYFKKWLNE